jgi:cob(I)alamin adenosyltransferase
LNYARCLVFWRSRCYDLRTYDGGENAVRTGLTIVFTGNGKGKTSAALGLALRASGHKLYVSIVQFIKGSMPTGEVRAVERLKPEVELITMGKGFVNYGHSTTPMEDHRLAAREALAAARQRMSSGSWDIVILDEVNTALSLGLIELNDVLKLISEKPLKLHLVLTGRDAHPAVIEAADLVTEMRNIKHPYDNGISAQQGIDF